ncbi:MAG: hypothetical protein LBH66_07745 [Oscillospiraceae bacterium]|jgi:hypothetical protein|nr:hypothetical protein [Oscillospiraceae bacterium]
MKTKLGKLSAALLAALMLAAAIPMSVLAHGHGSRQPSASSKPTASYKVCAVKSCAASGVHQHSGVYYKAHSSGDGHSYHNMPGKKKGHH